MKAHEGDRIILAASHVDDATRYGEVIEVRGKDGEPPFLIRWADGHTGLFYPGPGSVLRLGAEHEEVDMAPSAVSTTSHQAGSGSPATGVSEERLHIREWTVRVTIFESGDDTSARVVLVSDAPTHLIARGQTHPSDAGSAIPEIGDEVAVARALRHLADQLLEAAEQDVKAATGKDALIRPS